MATIGTVVVVPGISGSELRIQTFALGKRVVWLSPPALLAGGFRQLRLSVPGEDPGPPLGALIVPGRPLPYYYGFLQAFLWRRGWKVITAAGDWRKPLTEDATRVADLIESESPARRVCIIAHSRGGLVTRRALAILHSRGTLDRVLRVVGLGVPHSGSLDASSYLACWGYTKLLLQNLGKYLPADYGSVVGLSNVGPVVRSWPAVYELLPAPGNSWLQGVPAAALYVASNYQPKGVDPVQGYLNAAATRWETMPPIPAGVDWVDVAGFGSDTAYKLPHISLLQSPNSFETSIHGDGTVLVASAADGTRKRLLTPTGHDSLVLDGRLFPYLHEMLLDGLDQSASLSGKVFNLYGNGG